LIILSRNGLILASQSLYTSKVPDVTASEYKKYELEEWLKW
jgi:hypothetical protein